MSEENVGIVKAFFTAFAERDHAAAAAVLDPDVEIRPAIVGGPEGVVYRGHPGNRRFWHDINAAWKEFRIETEEFRDLGERVLVLGRAFARGEGSGIALDEPVAWLAAVREGRIVEFRSFSHQQEALEAAGLSE
jgi:ketosteroid isomerase-like protein